MLIDFAITNFRSIKERQVFSLQSVSRIAEKPENTFQNSNFNLLRSAIIYGRNASGKSNLLFAMDCLRRMIVSENQHLIYVYFPFKILKVNEQNPTTFEVNFLGKSGKRYNYYLAYDGFKIVEENLYHYPEGKQARLFLRKGNEIKTDVPNLKDSCNNLYPYHTVLSRLNFFKIDGLLEPFRFFHRHFVTKSFIGEDDTWERNVESVLNRPFMPNHLQNLSKILKVADTGIDSIEFKILEKEDLPFSDAVDESIKIEIFKKNKFKVKIKHPVFEDGKNVGSVDFDLKDESAGTRKLLLFGSCMLDCLSDGDVLVVDELDKGLHPKLMTTIIKIFNNPKTNPNNAQLIITSHDVSLLSESLFRRDQVWISEKNISGASEYYSLADINGVRVDVPMQKYFMKGVFGGVPVINEYDFEFNLDRTDRDE